MKTARKKSYKAELHCGECLLLRAYQDVTHEKVVSNPLHLKAVVWKRCFGGFKNCAMCRGTFLALVDVADQLVDRLKYQLEKRYHTMLKKVNKGLNKELNRNQSMGSLGKRTKTDIASNEARNQLQKRMKFDMEEPSDTEDFSGGISAVGRLYDSPK